MPTYRICEGLPAYGPRAVPFPSDFGRLGREGVVVTFQVAGGESWTGNFKPGIAGLNDAIDHPDGRRVIVFANGDAWAVDPETRGADALASGVLGFWGVDRDFVFDRQGLAFVRVGRTGVVWHSKRLSWDGFKDVRIDRQKLSGLSWSFEDIWLPFAVDLATGRSSGGAFGDSDTENWEQVAEVDAS